MASRVWFTSDHHFFHERLAKCRDFDTVDQMNAELVYRWNNCVRPGDRVYHLGDVSLGTHQETAELLPRLRGEIYLVRGNHEDAVTHPECRESFVWIKDLHYMSVRPGERKVMLCHYPMVTWRSSHHGSWHLHGHCHGKLPDAPYSLRLDVGVDCWGLAPVSFEQIAERMALKATT